MSEPEPVVSDYLNYDPDFLGDAEAEDLLDRLWRDLAWSRRSVTLFGKQIPQPRLVAWYGDAGASYTYSGLTLRPRPWHPLLQDLRARVEAFTAYRFNAVLANAYRDGRDSMGWHADDERELGYEPTVASLSLGAPRRFRLRPRRRTPDDATAPCSMILDNGSLLVMQPGCQERFQHEVPRTRRTVGLRINLTFRNVVIQTPV